MAHPLEGSFLSSKVRAVLRGGQAREFSTWGGEGHSHCLTHLPLRLRLLLLLLATGCCVERTWHTAHHRRAPPRAPGGVIGTIELQGAEGEVGLRAHARHPMQTKGVLLPLGQQPGGTGVGSSRVKQCSCLFAHNPPPTQCLHHPPTLHDHSIPPLPLFTGTLYSKETKGKVSFQAERPQVTQIGGSLGTFCSRRTLWEGDKSQLA